MSQHQQLGVLGCVAAESERGDRQQPTEQEVDHPQRHHAPRHLRGPDRVFPRWTATIEYSRGTCADLSRVTGLTGLLDRIEASGGTLEITSAPGSGTHCGQQSTSRRHKPTSIAIVRASEMQFDETVHQTDIGDQSSLFDGSDHQFWCTSKSRLTRPAFPLRSTNSVEDQKNHLCLGRRAGFSCAGAALGGLLPRVRRGRRRRRAGSERSFSSPRRSRVQGRAAQSARHEGLLSLR